MSLLLRKVCQPVLDDYGLGHLHTTEIDYTKRFRLITECGNSGLTISSIKFTKPSPNISEIEYAAVLLGEYLDKNIDKVQLYLNAKAAFNNCPILTPPEDVTFIHKYDGLGGVNRIVNYKNKDKLIITAIITKKGKYEVSIVTPATLTRKEAINYKIDKTLLDLMLTALVKDGKKADLKQAAKDALAELATCTI